MGGRYRNKNKCLNIFHFVSPFYFSTLETRDIMTIKLLQPIILHLISRLQYYQTSGVYPATAHCCRSSSPVQSVVVIQLCICVERCIVQSSSVQGASIRKKVTTNHRVICFYVTTSHSSHKQQETEAVHLLKTVT